jgi:hypothetical protein
VWKHDAPISIKALQLIGNHVSVKAFVDKTAGTPVTGPGGVPEEAEVDFSQLSAEELERLAELEKLMEKAIKRKK